MLMDDGGDAAPGKLDASFSMASSEDAVKAEMLNILYERDYDFSVARDYWGWRHPSKGTPMWFWQVLSELPDDYYVKYAKDQSKSAVKQAYNSAHRYNNVALRFNSVFRDERIPPPKRINYYLILMRKFADNVMTRDLQKKVNEGFARCEPGAILNGAIKKYTALFGPPISNGYPPAFLLDFTRRKYGTFIPKCENALFLVVAVDWKMDKYRKGDVLNLFCEVNNTHRGLMNILIHSSRFDTIVDLDQKAVELTGYCAELIVKTRKYGGCGTYLELDGYFKGLVAAADAEILYHAQLRLFKYFQDQLKSENFVKYNQERGYFSVRTDNGILHVDVGLAGELRGAFLE